MPDSARKKRRHGLGKPSPGAAQAPGLVDIAGSLDAEVSRLEGVTARVARLELNDERNIQRASELLKEASDSHDRFLGHLRALVEGVDRAKQRHNSAADTLSERASRLEERRNQYRAFQDRFAALAADTREVIGLMQGGPEAEEGTPDEATALERLRAAGLRLAATAEAARALGTDARQAHFVDLDREADAIRQQLQALAKKLQRAEQAGRASEGKEKA